MLLIVHQLLNVYPDNSTYTLYDYTCAEYRDDRHPFVWNEAVMSINTINADSTIGCFFIWNEYILSISGLSLSLRSYYQLALLSGTAQIYSSTFEYSTQSISAMYMDELIITQCI